MNFFNIIIDLIIVCIIGAGVYFGLKGGFIKLIAKPVRFILVLILAFSLCNVTGKYIISPIISPSVTGYISSFLHENMPDISAANALDELPTLIKMGAAMAGLDIESVVSNTSGGDLIDKVVTELTAPAIEIIAIIIAFLLLFVVGKAIVWLVIKLIDKLFEHGVLGAVNKVLGCVFATVFAIIVAWAFAVFFGLTIHLPIFEGNSFTGGFIYKFFNNFNPIELLLSF